MGTDTENLELTISILRKQTAYRESSDAVMLLSWLTELLNYRNCLTLPPAEFTPGELDLFRQWYNAIQDLNPKYLNCEGFKDTELYNKVMTLISLARGHDDQSKK